MNRSEFSGRVVVVTGASRGIGREVALSFARGGDSLVLISRKLSALEALQAEIEAAGGRAASIACHIGRTDDIRRAAEVIRERFGRVDVLVNNAATNPAFGSILDVTDDVWDKIMEVNVRGYFVMTRELVPLFPTSGGAIVNISSMAGISPTPLIGAYSVSKAADISLTKVLARELAHRSIRVNAVAPGLIRTDFSAALWSSEEILAQALEPALIKRIGTPAEVAAVVTFLASEAAGYVTGSVYSVDGGSTL